jgi:DNA-binding transcriptional regulator YiaG
MNKFTAKQKEIVARKLGYDGPMQGFDDFIKSSPALGMKYASLSDKFATRMAKGGMAKKKHSYAVGGSVSNDDVRNFLASNPGLSDQQIAAKMTEFNVSPAQMAQVTGISAADVQARFDAATKPATTTPPPGATSPVTTAVAGPSSFATATPASMGIATTPAPIPTAAPAAPAPTPVAPVAAAPKVSNEDVAAWLNANPTATDAQIAKAAADAGVSAAQLAQVTGLDVGQVESRIAAATAPAPTATAMAPAAAPTKPTAPSDAEVANWFKTNPNASDFDIATAMTQYGVTADQVAKATGVATTEVQSRYNTATDPKVVAVQSAFKSGDMAATQAAFNNSGLSADQLAATFNLKQEDINYLRDSYGIKIPPTTTEVKAWLDANPTATSWDVKTAIDQNGVKLSQVAAALKMSEQEVKNWYDSAKAPTTQSATVVPPVTSVFTNGTSTTRPIDFSPALSSGAPGAPQLTTYTAFQTATPEGAVAGQAAPTTQAGVTNVAAPTPIGMPTPITAPTAATATAAPGVAGVLGGVEAQQGVVSDAAKAVAATQAPETTAVAGMEAAQGVAGTVQGAPTRAVEAGEMVSGPSVDMARVEQTLAQTQAAQGVVTDEMTVQGQLNKLTKDFDAGNPPPWAAASMRAATAQMAARGLGASSMAGQAIIQATLEAATPIAAADAKVFETMGLQNLSNRQQTAMLIGQQRAAFLGQEFDQAFQTKVLNAAKISDIANRNFDAQTTIALENSRLANSMDIANLSARNAVVLGKMAQMSQLETQNLSNRQQVAVENARNALAMDIKNLDNRQQTTLFRAQELNDALVSDAGFANATNITNANNALDAQKVSASLAQSAQQFNADLLAKVNMSNALAANEIAKFNAQQANAREEFNANMTTQINLANAKILAEISTANTAAANAAAAVNAKNATDLSSSSYAQQSQTYRDLLEMSWKTGENELERANSVTIATITGSASTNAARTTADRDAIAKIASTGVSLLANYDKVKQSTTSFLQDLGIRL